ncbi:helix-turn-helix transcriptional regulator [Yoonia sp. 208BN28-4]|uniref:helix-turn-helix transcriptional regulator n=1 Tax=Yoonia sp. 208BN28-4 TaxID=3126505 RepID=UPI0030ACD897
MTQLRLCHKDILQGDAMAQISRVMLTNKRPKALHDHDFFEVFWVQNGTVRHHTADGSETLKEGAVVFVQPQHTHALQGSGEAAMIVTVTIHPALVAQLGAAHETLQGSAFWADTDRPIIQQRDSLALAALNRAAISFEGSPADTLHTTAFLLPLCTALIEDTGLPHDAPDWLRHACIAARDPRVFRQGAAGLVAQTGRAHAHVTRTLKRYGGTTPATYINAIRMTHAARALIGSSDTLADIAEEIGIPNLSHFHKQFRAFHGQSPAQFRSAKQRNVAQPE